MKTPARKNIGPPFDVGYQTKEKMIAGKVLITDKGQTCRQDDCKCTCYHVHDEVAGLFVLEKSKACKEHK